MRTWVMTATAFALASCGGSNDTTAPDQAEAAPETGAAAQVARLDETQLNGVLERAIRAAGSACPQVVRSERAEVRKGIRGWKATCDNGSAHLIEITSDGTANVTSRTQ